MILYLNFAKKILFSNLLFLAIFIFVEACGSRYFLASSDNEIQKIDKEDHQFCVSLGLDFGEDELKTEIYWRCRVALANNKIKPDALTPEELRHNITLKKLVADIAKNYNASSEKWSDNRNSLLDNNDHKSCVTQGHNIDSLEPVAVEDYFICRRRLINNQQMIPPYRKIEYFKRPQDTYNIGLAVNKKTDSDIAKFEAVKAEYPKCVTLDFRSEEFKICKSEYDQQRKCLSKIEGLKFKRELQEKTSCQKKSYVRFPDSMLKDDSTRAQEIAHAKTAADLSNSNNFFSIGIDADQMGKFSSEEGEMKKDDNQSLAKDAKASVAKEVDKKNSSQIADAKTKIVKNFNTKDDLYSKIDLTKLRQQFIFSCQEAINSPLASYGNKLRDECNSIVEKWEEQK